MPEPGVASAPDRAQGPLHGVRFVEFAGLGPVPFAAMVLADLGAEGIRVEAPSPGFFAADPTAMATNRGRASVAIDLKHPDGQQCALHLIERADILIEGFRPGVMERLGLGPQPCLARNPRLVYGRMTGWGQDGPLAQRAGHDLTYLAVAGVLGHIGRAGAAPTPPLNLVADYGGGAMLLVAGVLAALVSAGRAGAGQVVDAAMVDGAALLMSTFHSLAHQGLWRDERGTNLLDSGAPFYDVYTTADGSFVAVAALEPQFYAALVAGLAAADPEFATARAAPDFPDQYDVSGWPVIRAHLARAFATRTRDAWVDLFEGTDACVAPVLSMSEAPNHPHLKSRATFSDAPGDQPTRSGSRRWPAPAPRFSGTPCAPPAPVSAHGSDAARLVDWGLSADEVAALQASGVIAAQVG